MTGGFVSTTVMVVLHEAELVPVSATTTAIVFVPTGRTAAKETFVPKMDWAPGIELVCMGKPFTDQITPRSLPCGSPIATLTVLVVLHETVAGSGHVITGAA